ncbi:MAG: hypothetical protein ACTS2F_09350 [Thainema sp.]
MSTPKRPTDEQMKADRKQDVLLLLEHLAYNEQTTIRLILDCLYDIGATNLINENIRVRPLNRATRGVARISKPVFRAYALRWFQKNCPELIANWLFKKVEFTQKVKKKAKPKVQPLEVINPDNYESSSPPPSAQVPAPTTAATPVAATVVSPEAKLLDQEVRQLRTQVKLLTGTLVFAIAALGATVVIIGGNARFSGYPFVEDPHTAQLKTVGSHTSAACPTSGEDSKLTSVK